MYRVLQASTAQSRLDVPGATGLTPLVGREAELTLLVERWAQSQDGLGQVVVAKTDGVPLFVEELFKMILESGLVQEAGERYGLTGPLPPLAIPTTLQDSLMARLDRLAPVKEVAQLGAVLGRSFPYDLI